MAGHNYVNQIADAATKAALLDALGLIAKLTARVAALEGSTLKTTGPMDAGAQTITNVKDAAADSDVVNLRTLRNYVAAQGEAFS